MNEKAQLEQTRERMSARIAELTNQNSALRLRQVTLGTGRAIGSGSSVGTSNDAFRYSASALAAARGIAGFPGGLQGPPQGPRVEEYMGSNDLQQAYLMQLSRMRSEQMAAVASQQPAQILQLLGLGLGTGPEGNNNNNTSSTNNNDHTDSTSFPGGSNQYG